MCGFAGEFTTGRAPDRDAVERMAATMADRGPDSAGSWADGQLAVAAKSKSHSSRQENGSGVWGKTLRNIELFHRFGETAFVGEHGTEPVAGERRARIKRDGRLEFPFGPQSVPVPEKLNEAERCMSI